MKQDIVIISKQSLTNLLEKLLPSEPMKNEYTQGITCGVALSIECVEQFLFSQRKYGRCYYCLLHGVCTYENALGKDGFCSQWKRREDV